MARRLLHKLSEKFIEGKVALPLSPCVKQLKLGDGGGLMLIIDKWGARWLFCYTSPVSRKRREMGLGPYPSTSLRVARDEAATARLLIEDGHDPIDERQREGAPRFYVSPINEQVATQTSWASSLSDAWWQKELDRIQGLTYTDVVEMYSSSPGALAFIEAIRKMS